MLFYEPLYSLFLFLFHYTKQGSRWLRRTKADSWSAEETLRARPAISAVVSESIVRIYLEANYLVL
mgnify:CR=1 FL=1